MSVCKPKKRLTEVVFKRGNDVWPATFESFLSESCDSLARLKSVKLLRFFLVDYKLDKISSQS